MEVNRINAQRLTNLFQLVRKIPEIKFSSKLRNLAAAIIIPPLEWSQKMDYFRVINYIFAAAKQFGAALGEDRESIFNAMAENFDGAKIADWDIIADGLLQKFSSHIPYPDLLGLRAKITGNHLLPDFIRNMINHIKETHNLNQPRIFAAMEKFPRHWFVPADRQFFCVGNRILAPAYDDHPLSIDRGQTISQPYMVAHLTKLLDLKGDEEVLVVGTGSGYQDAILSELCKKIYSIDIIPEFVARAEKLFKFLGLQEKIEVKTGNGWEGWPQADKLFERILVTAGADEIPEALKQQLKIGGKLILPVSTQKNIEGEKIYLLWQVSRISQTKFKQNPIPDSICLFVPLVKESTPPESDPAPPLTIEINSGRAEKVHPALILAQKIEFLMFLKLLSLVFKENNLAFKKPVSLGEQTPLAEIVQITTDRLKILEEKKILNRQQIIDINIKLMALSNLPDFVEGLVKEIEKKLEKAAKNYTEIYAGLDKILDLLRIIPRHWFLPMGTPFKIIQEESGKQIIEMPAYKDNLIRIGNELFSSRPSLASLSALALKLKGGETILEMGADSGFQAALLSELLKSLGKGGSICAVRSEKQFENSPEISEYFSEIIKDKLNCQNLELIIQNPETLEGKFDRILLTLAPLEPGIPAYLLNLLAEGGCLVLPAYTDPDFKNFPSLIQIKKIAGKPEIKIILKQISDLEL